MMRSDGELLWTRWGLSLIRDDDGKPGYLVGQYQDRTPEHEAEQRLAFLAHYDGLTGLHNRAWIAETLGAELRPGRRRKAATVGLLHLDLDGFRAVNDSMGAAAGDHLLQIVGGRIRSTVPDHAVVARISGDEFVVVVTGAGAEGLEALAATVQKAVAVEVVLGQRRVLPSVSAGIAVSQADSTAESLLRDAALAHGSAKSSGRSHRRVYDEALAAEAARRLRVAEELRDAIARDELVVHYQPLVRLNDRQLMGFEALVRWQHPTLGLLGPDAFLTIAEDTGLVVELGEQVLQQVCRAMLEQPHVARRVSVNISAVQLADPQLVARIIDCLHSHGVDPTRLVVEVTETAVVSQVALAQDTLGALREVGIGVHMDDFGTGYSSISLLRDLPVTGLKLDRRFVSELTAHDSDANVLSAGLAGLALGLGLESIAEGIETEEEAALVAAQGWTHGQGYLFDRPLPLEHWTG
jgi:diguanylate cyclase (GGDEF)-like protein